MSDQAAPLYLLAGGHRSASRPGPDPWMRAALRRTGITRPRVAYIGAASGDHPGFQARIGQMLEAAGAGEVALAPLCGNRANPDRAKAVVAASDLVFISGGDVEEGMRVLREQGMIALLKTLYRSGVPFLGISAGSIMLAERWVRWRDPEDDESAELFPCLGVAALLCDTHGEEEGWAELRAALAISAVGTTGYGIVSGGALLVEPAGGLSLSGGTVNVFRKEPSGVVQLADVGAARG